MKTFYYLFLFLFTYMFVSCDSVDITFEEDKDLKEAKGKFETERTAWERQNIKNYQFSYTYDSDACPYKNFIIQISVEENKNPVIIDPELLPTILASKLTDYPENIPLKSISHIFDLINYNFDFLESVKNGTYDGHDIKSVYIDIKYHPKYHYPTTFDMKIRYADKYIDGGGGFEFQVLEFIP